MWFGGKKWDDTCECFLGKKSALYFYAIIIPPGTVISMDPAWIEQYTKSWTISCNHEIIGPFSIHGIRERWTKLYECLKHWYLKISGLQ